MADILSRLRDRLVEGQIEEVSEVINLLVSKLDKMVELLEEQNELLKRIKEGGSG